MFPGESLGKNVVPIFYIPQSGKFSGICLGYISDLRSPSPLPYLAFDHRAQLPGIQSSHLSIDL